MSATSYVDAQIGRIPKALDDLGLRERTVVVLWGDLGLQIGEHGLWCKHTNFEAAARAPLIFRAPGRVRAGARVEALAARLSAMLRVGWRAALPEGPGGSEIHGPSPRGHGGDRG